MTAMIYCLVVVCFICIVYSACALLVDPNNRIEGWRDNRLQLLASLYPIVRPLSKLVDKFLTFERRKKAMSVLQKASLEYTISVSEFFSIKLILVLISITVSTLCIYFIDGLGGIEFAVLMLTPLLAFFYLDMVINDIIKKRINEAEKQIPFFLDLLVLSLKTGMNFTLAIKQIENHMPVGCLKSELARIMRDINGGCSRRESLLNMTERLPTKSVINFVAAVNQAEETGGELSPILQDQAEFCMVERFNRAEKKANEAPVKMLFPLVVFLFPLTILIIMFPIAMKAMDAGLFGGL